MVLVLAGCGSGLPAPSTFASLRTADPTGTNASQPATTAAPAGPTPTLAGDTIVSLDPATMEAKYRAALPLFAYDADAPLELERADRTEHAGVVVEKVTFSSPLGGEVPGYIVAPAAREGLPGLLWIFPGPASDLVDRAVANARLGMIVIVIDPPQIRRSRDFSLTFSELDHAEHIQLVVELRRAVDVLIDEGADPNRLAFVGYSWGAVIGAALAGVEPRIGSYVLMYGDGGVVEHFLESPDRTLGANLSTAQRDAWLATMEPLESLYFIGHAAPSALLFQNGQRDEVIARQSAERLHRYASEPKEVRWYDSGHDPTPDAPEVWCEQAAWLTDRLELPPTPVPECSRT